MLQFNAKEMKAFRDNLAKWHIADFDKKDAQITRQRRIALNDAKIAQYQEDIDAYNAGDKKVIGKTIEERIAEVNAQIEKLEVENKFLNDEYTAHAEALEKNFNAGYGLIDDDFAEALAGYVNDMTDETEKNVTAAAIKFFEKNGAKGVVADDVRRFIRPLGVKIASAKKSCESGKHTTGSKGRALKNLWLAILCDDEALVSMLPVYKWKNKIEKKNKKDNSVAA